MLRVGLAIYLTLATVAGPAFCCCSIRRCADRLARLAQGTGSVRCKCGHHDARGEQRQESDRNGCPAEPGKPCCPSCYCSQDVILLGAAPEWTRQGQGEKVTDLGQLLFDSKSLLPEKNHLQLSGPSLASLFLTCHERLCALQVWRC